MTLVPPSSASIGEAIGTFVIEFSILEMVVDDTIRRLLWFSKSEQDGRLIIGDQPAWEAYEQEEIHEEEKSRYRISNALLGELDFARKARILYTLVSVRVPHKNLDQLEKLTKRLAAQGNIRNEMFHSAWVGGANLATQQRIQRSNVSREARLISTDETPDSIDKKTSVVAKLTEEMISWSESATSVVETRITFNVADDPE